MPDRFVTIGRFSMLVEAQAIKNELEEHNITAFIIDDSVGGSYPGLGDSVGGITMHVREEDYDRAEEILGSFLGGRPEEEFADDSGIWICTGCDTEVKEDSDICPNCGAAKDALRAERPSLPQPLTAPVLPSDDEDDNPATALEKSTANVVKSDRTRGIIVGLLLTPTVLFFLAASGLLGLVYALLSYWRHP